MLKNLFFHGSRVEVTYKRQNNGPHYSHSVRLQLAGPVCPTGRVTAQGPRAGRNHHSFVRSKITTMSDIFLGVSNSDALSAASSETKLSEVILRDAYKEENSIVIKWETETSQILGFRVVYRLFGKPEFKQGPPLAPSEREFRIKNVPLNVSFEIKKLTNTISINWSLIKLALKGHS